MTRAVDPDTAIAVGAARATRVSPSESIRHACSPKYPSRVGLNIRLAGSTRGANSFVVRSSSVVSPGRASRPKPPASVARRPKSRTRCRARDGRNPRPRDGRNPPSQSRLRRATVSNTPPLDSHRRSVADPSPTVPSSRSSSNRNDSRRRRRRGQSVAFESAEEFQPRAPASSPPRAAPSPDERREHLLGEDTTRVSTRDIPPKSNPASAVVVGVRVGVGILRLLVFVFRFPRALHRASRRPRAASRTSPRNRPRALARTRARATATATATTSRARHLFSGDGHLFSTSKSYASRARAASGAGAISRARRARENIFPAMPR